MAQINTAEKQGKLLQDLWAVYYDNPLFDDKGNQREETHQQVIARALIAVLNAIELPSGTEVPE